MFRKQRVKRWTVVGAAVLVLALGVWLYQRFSIPRPYRLVAIYPTQDELFTLPPNPDYSADYLQFVNDNLQPIATRAGIFVKERGGNLFRTEPAEGRVAFRDWRGRQRWVITTPKCAYRDFIPSPSGKYLAVVMQGPGCCDLWVYRDGKLAWQGEMHRFEFGSPYYMLDSGRFIYWKDDTMIVYQEGDEIAISKHLPKTIRTATQYVERYLSPDGTALVSETTPIVPEPDLFTPGNRIMVMRRESKTLTYQGLVVQGRTITTTVRHALPRWGKDWRFFGGDMLLNNIDRLCDKHGEDQLPGGWMYGSGFGVDASMDLWQGNTLVLQRNSVTGMMYGAYHIPTRHVWRLPNPTDGTYTTMQASDDGKSLLIAHQYYDYPDTPFGRFLHRFDQNPRMRQTLAQRYGARKTLELHQEKRGLCAYLPLPMDQEGLSLTAGGQSYQPLKFGLSPDGKDLVVWASSKRGKKQVLLHYKW